MSDARERDAHEIERLRSLVAELDRLLSPEVSPAVVDAGGYPGAVAAGELIESAWGNAVSNKMYETRVQAIQSPASPFNTYERVLIQQGNAVVTTDASGVVNINFPTPFSNVPTVIAWPGDYNVPARELVPHDTSQTWYFAVRALTSSGSPVANGPVRIMWLAVGMRTGR